MVTAGNGEASSGVEMVPAQLWDGTGLLLREEALTVARRRDDAGFGGAKARETS